ncbi:MAG: pilus assembly protein [Lachnospiraceae bacterium]|nr:pilus assembly protein [Lachnospiraceae bacterium]
MTNLKKTFLLSLRAKMRKGTAKGSEVSGSMTLEAAMALPIFLFFFLNLLCLFQMLYVKTSVNQALHATGKELASYAYLYREGINASEYKDFEGMGMAGSVALSVTAAKSMLLKNLGSHPLLENSIKGGTGGISLVSSSVLSDRKDEIKLVATYTCVPLTDFMGFGGIRLASVYFGHGWTGYTLGSFTQEYEGEEIVYITEHGTAYHRDLNCSHLKLSVRTISASQIGKARNKSGAIYKPCEICGMSSSMYIVTDYGDRYHTSARCSGLKRTIDAVPISKVGGRSPCQTCAY